LKTKEIALCNHVIIYDRLLDEFLEQYGPGLRLS